MVSTIIKVIRTGWYWMLSQFQDCKKMYHQNRSDRNAAFSFVKKYIFWSFAAAAYIHEINVLPALTTLAVFQRVPTNDNILQEILVILWRELGIPLASEKLEGPALNLSFSGFILNTSRMEIRLPEGKLFRTQKMIKAWLQKRKPLSSQYSPTS